MDIGCLVGSLISLRENERGLVWFEILQKLKQARNSMSHSDQTLTKKQKYQLNLSCCDAICRTDKQVFKRMLFSKRNKRKNSSGKMFCKHFL